MFSLLSESPSKHQGYVWSSLKDFSFLPTAQQDLELKFCDGSQAVLGATEILQSSSISHISKRKIIFQNYSKGKDLPFPQGLYQRFTVLLNLVYAFVAIPFLFFFLNCIFYFFPVPGASLLITFPSIPSKI